MHASKIIFCMKTKNKDNPWREHNFWNQFYWIRNILTSKEHVKHTKFYHQNMTSEGDQGRGITCVNRQNVISSSLWPHTENNLREKNNHTQNKTRSKQIEKAGIMRKSKKGASLPYCGIWWARRELRQRWGWEARRCVRESHASTIHHREEKRQQQIRRCSSTYICSLFTLPRMLFSSVQKTKCEASMVPSPRQPHSR